LKQQYVFERNEYLELCNELERISYAVTELNRKLNEEDKKRLRENFITIDEKLNALMKKLNWA
jgi:hypothetical protein